MIDLESHWSMEERPYVPFCKSEREYEEHFQKLLEKYPAPKGIGITVEVEEDDENHRPVKVL